MASLNKVQLIGNLGRDPEIRFGQDGSKFINFTMATNERWRDKQTNEMRDKTEWHRVVVFNERLADICEQYLKKGSRVYVEGQLQTRKWTDNAGLERYTTEIVLSRFRGEMVMLDANNRNDSQIGSNSYQNTSPASNGYGEPGFDIPATSSAQSRSTVPDRGDFDDDIPF